MFTPFGKNFICWFSILTPAVMLQGLLPMSDHSWVTDYALLIAASLAFFHASCATMYEVSCRILKKWCPDEMRSFRPEDFVIRFYDSAVNLRNPHAALTSLSESGVPLKTVVR